MAKRVLVVDDAAFMRMMLKDILTAGGYQVVGEASDGNEAVQKYKELQPDLVTLDVVMPDVDGVQALKNLRAEDPQAVVVMVSAMGQEALIQEANEAGAKGFIVKPFRPDAVLTAMAEAVG